MSMKKFFVGVKGIIYVPGQGVLLLKHEKGFWDVPGGRIDGEETIHQTLAREIAEELPGATLRKVVKLENAYRLPKDVVDDTSLVLLYYLVEIDLPSEVKLSDEHVDYLWVKTRQQIPDLSWNPQVLNILENILK